jgi:hypothetical protein
MLCILPARRGFARQISFARQIVRLPANSSHGGHLHSIATAKSITPKIAPNQSILNGTVIPIPTSWVDTNSNPTIAARGQLEMQCQPRINKPIPAAIKLRPENSRATEIFFISPILPDRRPIFAARFQAAYGAARRSRTPVRDEATSRPYYHPLTPLVRSAHAGDRFPRPSSCRNVRTAPSGERSTISNRADGGRAGA